MNGFVQVLSQIAWGVTVGGLTAAATAGATAIAVGGCAAGGACLLWKWKKRRARRASGR